MSDYIAEAKVLVLPDVSKFNVGLKTQLNKKISEFNSTTAKTLKPIQIPVTSRNITKAQLNASRVAAQKTAATLKPVTLRTQLGGVSGQATGALSRQTRTTSLLAGATANLGRQANTTKAKMLGLGSATARVDAALLGLRTAVGSTAVIGLGAGALAAIALGNALRRTIGITVEFERELNTFQAVTGASANEMERVAAAAKQLGADVTLPAVSAADAAVAMAELAKAGLSVQDAIDGARGVLQLATAANIGFADAVEIAASAINAFGLSGKDAVKVADTLANAANAAQGSITDIGIAFQQANAVGALAGLTFQDTTVFLTQLAQAGLKSSDAGTSLRTALIRLINPSKKAAEIIKELGIEIRDEAGNIRPDVFLQFASAMQGMSKETRDAKLAVIGGQDALRAFAILGRASVKDFLALRRELREEGTAAEVAAARTKGLGGSFQALQSTLETLGITLGQKVSPGLTDFVNGVTSSISALSQSQGVAAAFQAGLTGVATALNAVGAAASIVGPILLGTVNLLSKVTLGFGSSLVTGLLAAIAGLKLYSAVAKSAIVSNTLLRASMLHLAFVQAAAGATQAAGAIGGLTRTIVGLRAAIALALTSVNFWAIGITAVAAGLVFLWTRMSATERAARNLASATDALAASLGRLDAARRGKKEAGFSEVAARIGVERAKDEVAAARAQVAATKGTDGRREAVFRLVTALQSLEFAEEELDEAQKRSKASANEQKAAEIANSAARRKAVEALNDSIKRTQERSEQAALIAERAASIEAGRAVRGEGGKGTAGRIAAARIAAETAERKKLIAVLREQAKEEFQDEDAFTKDMAQRKDLLADLARRLKALPDAKTIKLLFDGASVEQGIKKITPLFAKFGFDSATEFVKWLSANLLGGLKKNASPEIQKWLKELEGDFAEGGARASAAFTSALSLSDITNIFEATGVPVGEQLRKLRVRAAKQQAEVDRLNAIPKGQRTQEQQDKLAQQSAALNATNAEIRRIQGDIRSAQEERVRLAEQAQDDQDKAGQALFEVLTSTGKGIRALNKKLEDAGVTPTLTDDIKFTKILLAVYRKIQKNLARRLKELGASASVIRELTRGISDLVNDTARDLKKLQQDQADAIKAANEAARDALMAKFDAQIRFFEIKGDIQGEIKARTARLKAITAQLAKLKNAGKRYTAAWWDLKAQQAEEIAAIKELKGQTKEKNKEQAALMFAFLQAQQGFAANLLGNVIGLGATSGLVGNISAGGAATAGGTAPGIRTGLMPEDRRTNLSPGGDLVTQSQISAGAKLGVSRGQGTAQTEILRQILDTLKDIKRGQGFPEARYQAARASAAQDTGGGGGVQTA